MDNLKPSNTKSNRTKRLVLAAAISVFILLIGLLWFSQLKTFILNLFDDYLTMLEGMADRFLLSIGSGVSIREHNVFVQGEFAATLDDGYLLKKWTLLLLVLFWITPARLRPKLVYSGLVLLVNPIGSLINISLTAYLLLYFSYDEAASYIGRTPFVLIMLFFLISWIWRNRKSLFGSKIAKQFRLEFLEAKLPHLFVVLFIFVLLSNIFLGAFRYTIWIDFLFRISAWILNTLNYPASVQNLILVGEHGSIFLAKSCLGLNTMLLFASIVYFTGKESWIKWVYILGGVILLNLLNIGRFVMIFIHIQKNGGYVTEMNTHDLYNSIIYVIIFIMWIIWFEKFSYLRDQDP